MEPNHACKNFVLVSAFNLQHNGISKAKKDTLNLEYRQAKLFTSMFRRWVNVQVKKKCNE